jgi:hypothetical protein
MATVPDCLPDEPASTSLELHLTHGQRVRLRQWHSPAVAQVGTAEGHAAEFFDDITTTLENLRRMRAPLTWTHFSGCLLAYLPASQARQDAEYRRATILHPGQEVRLEGRRYVVQVVPGNTGHMPRHADPIRFMPLEDEL